MAKDLDNETVKIKSAQRCQARNGSNYFKLTIQDKEGENHNAMLWECHNEHEIGINNEINISCNYDPNYKNYTINCFRLVKKGRLGLTKEEQDSTFQYILEFLQSLEKTDKNIAVAGLLFTDKEKFKTAPAAITHHHNYIGGLLQHTAELIKYIEFNSYAKINYESCILAAIIHDYAKIFDYEIDVQTGVINYNEQFRESLGLNKNSKIASHIYWIHNWCIQKGFTDLAHIVGSHHATEDWGAMFNPNTQEAHLVFMADYYSSKFGKISVEHLPELPQESKKISDERCPECGDIMDEGCCHTGCLISEDEVPF